MSCFYNTYRMYNKPKDQGYLLKRQQSQHLLDKRNSTAKKHKKNRYNDTRTPQSFSISPLYRKQSKEIAFEDQITNHKKPLNNKQVKMMIRCLQQYCNCDQITCQEVSKRYQFAAKLIHHLETKYRLVGSDKQAIKNQQLLRHITPPSQIRCEYCENLGFRCDKLQLQIIEKTLEQDIQKLEDQLLRQFKRKQELIMIAQQAQKYQNKQMQIEHLRKVQALQRQMLAKLDIDWAESKEEPLLNFKGKSSVSLQLQY